MIGIYTGITKDNCLNNDKTHFITDDNCAIRATWFCTSGNGVDRVKGYYYLLDDNLPIVLSTIEGPLGVNDQARFIENLSGMSKKNNARIRIIPINGNGVFTLKVEEYYLPFQSRLL